MHPDEISQENKNVTNYKVTSQNFSETNYQRHRLFSNDLTHASISPATFTFQTTSAMAPCPANITLSPELTDEEKSIELNVRMKMAEGTSSSKNEMDGLIKELYREDLTS